MRTRYSWPRRCCRPCCSCPPRGRTNPTVRARLPRPAFAGRRPSSTRCSAPKGWPSPTSTRTARWTFSPARSWYERPTWKMHEIRKLGNYGNGLHGYSQSFACWADDLNGDGWPDLIVIGFPGNPCHWYENPKGKRGLLEAARNLAQRLQRDAAVRRPVRHRQARAAHGLAAEGQGQRGTDGLVHAAARIRRSRGRCTPSANRASPASKSPARCASRTAWAPATSTAMAGST